MSVQDGAGRAFLPRTRKSRALLAVLALASPKPVLRVELAELLWSRREKEQARASLRQSVHELQDTLGTDWSHLFEAERHHLIVKGPGLAIDAPTGMHTPDITLALLQRLGRPLLEDLNGLDPAFDRWLETERQRCVRVGRTIGESLLGKADDPAEALVIAEALLTIDRTHEGAWRALMRSHAAAGNLAAALDSFDACCAALAAGGGGRPSRETSELAVRLRGQAEETRPALFGLAAPGGREPTRAGAANGMAHGAGDGAANGMSSAGAAQPPAIRPALRPAVRHDRGHLRLLVPPLRPIGEDPDGFAAGLGEEVCAGLSRFRWISCVPGTAEGAEEAMQDIEMVLEGTVQQAGGRVRAIVKLVDRRTDGQIVWAGRFDRAMTDPLSLQDELGAAIVAQIDPELERYEGRRPAPGDGREATAQDLLLRALPCLYRLDRDSFLEARRLLEASLEADPASSATNGWLAYWNLLFVGQGWADDPDAASAEAARLAERAVMLDPTDARALTLAGHVRGFLARLPEEAIALHDRAIALNPNMALAWCFSGLAHLYVGRHDEAVRRTRQALVLSPSDPHGFFFDMAVILPCLMNGDWDGAIEAGRRAVQLNPLFSSSYKGYLAALGIAGRSKEASTALERLMQLEPGFSVAMAIERSPLSRPEDVALYADGLRRAGLPERSALPDGIALGAARW